MRIGNGTIRHIYHPRPCHYQSILAFYAPNMYVLRLCLFYSSCFGCHCIRKLNKLSFFQVFVEMDSHEFPFEALICHGLPSHSMVHKCYGKDSSQFPQSAAEHAPQVTVNWQISVQCNCYSIVDVSCLPAKRSQSWTVPPMEAEGIQ